MKIVSASYVNTVEYNAPEKWLRRISFYTGLLEELAKQYDVESIEQINYSGIVKKNSVTYHSLNFNKKKLRFPFALHRHIKKLNPDIVFVNGFIFPFQIMQLRRTLGNDVKIIVLHRAEKPFSGIKRYLQKLADKEVNAYLFASKEFGKDWIMKGIIKDPGKIHEVMQSSSSFYPGDRTVAKKLLHINTDRAFLWVGRLEANKDPLTVVKAFIKHLSIYPSAKLYMIYQEDQLLPGIKKIIDENRNLTDSIVLVGAVEHTQLQHWYNAADFFISGSHYEGSGIAVCEAMSCGCIPIVTDIISFRTMTGPGSCGLLYQPGNSEDLLSALLKIGEMNIELEREKTINQFRDELSFKALTKKIAMIIDSLR